MAAHPAYTHWLDGTYFYSHTVYNDYHHMTGSKRCTRSTTLVFRKQQANAEIRDVTPRSESPVRSPADQSAIMICTKHYLLVVFREGRCSRASDHILAESAQDVIRDCNRGLSAGLREEAEGANKKPNYLGGNSVCASLQQHARIDDFDSLTVVLHWRHHASHDSGRKTWQMTILDDHSLPPCPTIFVVHVR